MTARMARACLVAGAAVGLLLALGAAPVGADSPEAKATLRNTGGAVVGRAFLSQESDGVHVKVLAWGINPAGFHGFHVHANSVNNSDTTGDTPGFGVDCDASNGFLSADGHYNPGATSHGAHGGDLPVLLFNAGGGSTHAELRFVTTGFTVAQLLGDPDAGVRPKALIVHAKPDNYGNVPISPTNGYTANGTAATATAKTGDAGSRVACGLVQPA